MDALRCPSGDSPVKQLSGGEKQRLAIARALKLFKLKPTEWHVNVQPLSGSPANFALYSALVPVGGKIMGMKLSSGGHLTHGYPGSMTGKLWKPVQFELDKNTEVIDYEAIKKIAIEEKPNIIFVRKTKTYDCARDICEL